MKAYHCNLGLTDFKDVWQLQENILQSKQKNKTRDIILTTEHNHVYTLGKSGDRDHLLISEIEMKKGKIAYFEIDRGGDLTYHGPGQLVCYPILDLSHYFKDAHKYLRSLEEAVIMTLKHFGIESKHDSEYTGVWVENDKICAIGIKLSRWITMHGLALNVNNDLDYFGNIIPCGIFHKGVINMKKILGKKTKIEDVREILLENMKLLFKIDIENVDIDFVRDYYSIPGD